MSVRTTNFDAVAASAPLNREASTVRDGLGEHFTSIVKYNGLHSDLPLPCRAPTENEPQLVGAHVGWLKVLGLYEEPEPGRKQSARWVVRCVCGHYETRRAKAIKNPENTEDRCFDCGRTDILRKRANRPVCLRSRADDAARLDQLAVRS